MKAAIAAFVAAAGRRLAAKGAPAGSISLLITGDEEGPAINGTRKVLDWLVEQGEVLDACIVGEPTNPNYLGEMIKVGRRGSMTGHLTVHGTQGHVGLPASGRQSPAPAGPDAGRLTAEPLDQGNEHFQPSTLAITTIDVGNPADNVIPAKGSASFNIRFNDEHTSDTLKDWIRRTCDSVGGPYDLSVPGQRRVLPDAAGPLERSGRGRDPARDGAPAGTEHHRRHVRRALHQEPLPGRRVRHRRPDHAQGRRACQREPTWSG